MFLVGVAGHLFEIREDYQLARPLAPYAAVGMGASVALGALQAFETVAGLSLDDQARRALEAAERYSTVVRRPFHLVEAAPPALARPVGYAVADSSGV
ncbi:MAG: hypothetical protein AAF772_12025 [Acidobacteriota bacterium]